MKMNLNIQRDSTANIHWGILSYKYYLKDFLVKVCTIIIVMGQG